MNKIITSYPQDRYIAPRHNSARFTYHAASKTFSAEASDFNGTVIQGQLYDDACDVGLIIENRYSGQSVPFHHERDERDHEGELLAEHYAVTPEAVRKDGRLAGLKVVIFND